MKRLPLVHAALCLFNAAAALAIVAFTFLYIIPPAETENVLRGWRMKPAPADTGSAKRTAAVYRAVWETPLPVRYVPPADPSKTAREQVTQPRVEIAKLFTLNGTVASDDPRAGLAVLTEIATKKTLMLSADKTLPGTTARLTEIRKDHVVVMNDGQAEKLYVKAETSPAAPAGPAAPGGRPPFGRADAGTASPAMTADPKSFRTQRDAVNPNLWNVDRNERQYLLKSLPELRNQVGIRPVLRSDGTMNGVQIETLQAGSLLQERGVQTGDIIRKINGIPITSQDQGDQLLNNPQLRNAARYDIELERAGQVINMTYQINR